MDWPLDRCKWPQLFRSAVEIKVIPQITTNADDARQPSGQIAKSHSLDEIVKSIEHGADFCEGVLFAC